MIGWPWQAGGNQSRRKPGKIRVQLPAKNSCRSGSRQRYGGDPAQDPEGYLWQDGEHCPVCSRRNGGRSKEQLIVISEDVQSNKGCSQKMWHKLMDSQDPDLASTVHEIMLETLVAVEKSLARKLQCEADYLHNGSEVVSITEMHQGSLRQASRLPATYAGPQQQIRGTWWRWRTALGQPSWGW